MLRKVKDVADLAGVSIRTLHHYDRIGLLSPASETKAGYRLYSDEDLDRLQQILFFRELGFSLQKIGDILDSPTFDRRQALGLQQKALIEKRERLGLMIETIGKTIKNMEGELDMNEKEKFEGFGFGDNPYEEEARRRWGDGPVDGANEKVQSLGAKGREQLGQQMDGLFQKLAGMRKKDPHSEEVQQAIGEWHDFLNGMGHIYSPDAFRGLGRMYVEDERFTKNMDRYGEGFASFMADAMGIRADHLQD
ncbi:MerR family transcriptional regulator [Bhargavaea ullalensis]|uniref:DNA-binding transcriptional MerR regulator n=1 Tax=Bhargavaea ullalensis TaxID=1265685 RepID=A0ABV2GCJ6_9BACL